MDASTLLLTKVSRDFWVQTEVGSLLQPLRAYEPDLLYLASCSATRPIWPLPSSEASTQSFTSFASEGVVLSCFGSFGTSSIQPSRPNALPSWSAVSMVQ